MAKMQSDTPIVYRPKTTKKKEDEAAVAALGKAAAASGKATAISSPVFSAAGKLAAAAQPPPPQPTIPQPTVPVYQPPTYNPAVPLAQQIAPVLFPQAAAASAVSPAFKPAPAAAPVTTAQYANVGQLRGYEAQKPPTAASYPNQALDPHFVGSPTPPASVGKTVDTEVWKNQGRRAWPSAAWTQGTPAYAERMAGEAWARSGYDPAYLPKSMSPLLAEYLGIPEDERRKYYAGYATYDGKQYTWGMLATPAETYNSGNANTSSGSSYSSGSYGGGGYGGGGSGGSGNAYLPAWFMNMLNWRI